MVFLSSLSYGNLIRMSLLSRFLYPSWFRHPTTVAWQQSAPAFRSISMHSFLLMVLRLYNASLLRKLPCHSKQFVKRFCQFFHRLVLVRSNFTHPKFFVILFVIMRSELNTLESRCDQLIERETSCLHYLLPDKRDSTVMDRLRLLRNFETLKPRTAKFQNSLFP